MRVVLISATHPCHNPRLVREADSLAARGHDVRVIGVRAVPSLTADDERLVATRRWTLRSANILRSPWPNRLRALPGQLRREAAAAQFRRTGSAEAAQHAVCEAAPELLRLATERPADWFIAHTQTVLGVAAHAARRFDARLGFDCEDLLGEADQSEPDMVRALEQAWLPECAYVTVTSRAMGARLKEHYPFAAPKVLYNVFPLALASGLRPPTERPVNERLRVHWVGQTAGPGKGIEEAVEAAGLAGGGIDLTIRGNPSSGFGEALTRLAAEHNVSLRFLPHVHHDDLINGMGAFDVGLALERPTTLNYSRTVTNKLFLYLLAGLAVAATETPGQREVFEQASGIGCLYPAGRPDVLAAQFRRWRDDRTALLTAQMAAWQAARDRFCWDVEQEHYVPLLDAPAAAFAAAR